jgi:hypothetical protein
MLQQPFSATITLSSPEESDLLTLARLEAITFDNDDFTTVAFGKDRHSPEKYEISSSHAHSAHIHVQFSYHTHSCSYLNLTHFSYALRASQISPTVTPHRKEVLTKATFHDPITKTSEIVGYAQWIYVTDRQSPESLAAKAESERKEAEEEERRKGLSEEERQKEDESSWGYGANIKFCEDVFLKADEIMFESCGEGDYCSMLFLFPCSSNHVVGLGLFVSVLADENMV